MRCSKFCELALAAALIFVVSSAGCAQMTSYKNVGRPPTKDEINAWNIGAAPDGKGLPAGHGTAKEGAATYAQKCASCHGAAGEGGIGPRLVGAKALGATLTTLQPVRTIGSYWPYATTVWDYINRSMPRNQAGSLTPNEVYALTAFILYKSEIIQENEVMDATTLPKVQMPNRNGFIPARFADIPDERKRGCTQGVCP